MSTTMFPSFRVFVLSLLVLVVHIQAAENGTTTGVGASVSGPSSLNLTNFTFMGFPLSLDGHSDYDILVRLLLTGTTTPAPASSSDGWAWYWWLLLSLGLAFLVALLGLGVYQAEVSRRQQQAAQGAHAGVGYVKVIQVDLVHP